MMKNRTAKQILYGSGYLALIFLIAAGIYFIWLKPAPSCFDGRRNQNETGIDCGGVCSDCELKILKPFEVNTVKYFPADGKTAIVAEIKNSNSAYGANYFEYRAEVYGRNGEKIKSMARSSFIYAGEIKNLFETIDVEFKNVKKAEISLDADSVRWAPSGDFSRPSIQTRDLKIQRLPGENVSLTGFVKNSNAFGLSRARIIGFLFNSVGLMAAVSKTEIEKLPAFGEEPFKIFFPANIAFKNLASTSTQIFNLTEIDPQRMQVYVEAAR